MASRPKHLGSFTSGRGAHGLFGGRRRGEREKISGTSLREDNSAGGGKLRGKTIATQLSFYFSVALRCYQLTDGAAKRIRTAMGMIKGNEMVTDINTFLKSDAFTPPDIN